MQSQTVAEGNTAPVAQDTAEPLRYSPYSGYVKAEPKLCNTFRCSAGEAGYCNSVLGAVGPAGKYAWASSVARLATMRLSSRNTLAVAPAAIDLYYYGMQGSSIKQVHVDAYRTQWETVGREALLLAKCGGQA